MDCIKIQTKVLDFLEDQSDTSPFELSENIFKALYGLESLRIKKGIRRSLQTCEEKIE